MNERFKFRAWHKEYKRMVDVYKFGQDMGACEWVWHSNIYPTEDGEPVLNDWGAICERQEIITRSKLTNCEFMQCTGLKDKNGKLIFEGDIIKEWFGETGTYQVIYENSTASFIFSNLNDEDYDYDLRQNPDLFPDQDLEIIGNIHENPELLKAS